MRTFRVWMGQVFIWMITPGCAPPLTRRVSTTRYPRAPCLPTSLGRKIMFHYSRSGWTRVTRPNGLRKAHALYQGTTLQLAEHSLLGRLGPSSNCASPGLKWLRKNAYLSLIRALFRLFLSFIEDIWGVFIGFLCPCPAVLAGFRDTWALAGRGLKWDEPAHPRHIVGGHGEPIEPVHSF
jgi:hypothetical protein